MLELFQRDELEEGSALQINCIECGGKSVISSRTEKDKKVSDLYCSCKNPLCGHTFVMTLAFSHTLSPSASGSKRMMVDLLRSLPRAEQLELLQAATNN